MADQGGAGDSNETQTVDIVRDGLTAVTQKIIVVETQITKCLAEIEGCKDPKEKEFYWKSCEQLRDKEKQLREEKLLLLRQSAGVGGAGAGAVGNEDITLTVHPWYGYEEESIPATVSTIEALRQVVRDKLKRSDFKLYFSPLKDGGPILNQKTDFSSDSQFSYVIGIGGSKVFYTIGASPKTSPKKEKPKSPFIKHAGIGISFGELPVLFSDTAVEEVRATISSAAVDRRTVLLFAMPGSGKTRTVREGSRLAGCQYLRVKLSDGTPFFASLKRIARTPQLGVVDYRLCKEVFVDVCKTFIEEHIERARALRQGSVETDTEKAEPEVLLHFDECQLLMGSEIVTSQSFEAQRLFQGANDDPYLWHLVMPTFCDVLDDLVTSHSWLRAALSGTNFFAPLVLHTGSHLKVQAVEQFGVFPPQWVLNEVIDVFFVLDDATVREHLQRDLSFLCSNRRAVSHFCEALACRLAGKGEGSVVTIEEIHGDAEAAFDKWSRPISNALGTAPCVAAVQALALLTRPKVSKQSKYVTSDQKCTVQVISFAPHDDLQGIVEYGQAGGLNLLCSGSDVIMMVPTGCVLRYLTTKCSTALLSDRQQSLAAFCRVARESQPDTQKGHIFERAFAAELVMYGTKLYDHLFQYLSEFGTFTPDPLVFATCWLDHATIFQSRNEWSAHTVYCVRDDGKDKGQRWVDVGFPIIDEHGSNWKVMCELKCGYEKELPKLWKMCYDFFTKISSQLRHDEKVAVMFVSLTEFRNFVPKPRSDANESALEKRDEVIEMMKNDKRLIIVDGNDVFDDLTLPILDMIGGSSDSDIFGGVSPITERVSELTVYSSSGGAGGERK